MFQGLSEGTIIFLVSQALLFFAALVNIYVNMMIKFKDLDMRIGRVEKQDEKVMDKLDSIENKLNDLNIQLQNKKDKEN